MGTKIRMILILALDECEWLVSRSNHFTPRRSVPTHTLEAARMLPYTRTFYLPRKMFQIEVVGLNEKCIFCLL
jgi:hypothetical protein